MPLLTPAQMAALRTVGNHGLDSSAEIQRSIQVETPFGSSEQWATMATGVPCWVRATSLQGNISNVGMREGVIGQFRIHFEQGTDIRLKDRVIVAGETFDVIDANLENTVQVFTTVMGKRVE